MDGTESTEGHVSLGVAGGIMDVIARRTSCRAYRAAAVPRAMVERVLEAARLAPSACNRQPWRFAVATEEATRRRIVEDGFLPGLGMDWALGAPVLVVVGMDRSLVTHRLAPSLSGVDYPWVDIGIAGEHLVLAAEELGLGTCWIGWVRPKGLAKIAGWRGGVKAVAVITLGWPDESARRTPPAERRLALGEIVTWLDGAAED